MFLIAACYPVLADNGGGEPRAPGAAAKRKQVPQGPHALLFPGAAEQDQAGGDEDGRPVWPYGGRHEEPHLAAPTR